MKRIYFEGSIRDSVTIEGDAFHYLKNVIRIKEGEELGVLTHEKFAVCAVAKINRRDCVLDVLTVRDAIRHDYRLKVYQCLLKREYMDFAVEKYSELGATEIVPVISERSLNDLKDRTMERFHEIALKAVLQSENEQLPVIRDAVNIGDIEPDGSENILFYERCEKVSEPPVAKDMCMVIGPEGGFTDEEVARLVSKGFKAVKPVSQILKAETASVVFTGYVRMAQDNL